MSFSPQKVQGLPIFKDPSGFWARPKLKSGNRAWRKLDATEVTDAVVEWKDKASKHESFLAGTSATSPWEESLQTFAGLAKSYLAESCPTPRGEARKEDYCWWVNYRLPPLLEYFGDWHPNDIRLKHIDDYKKWRMKQFEGGKGSRMVELEWTTLSNIQKFGIKKGVVELAWISRDRPRLRMDNSGQIEAAGIRHARDVAPRSGDDIHAVAESLMLHRDSQPAAWAWMFACLTGLRKSELLRLRVDAPDNSAGHSDDKFLWVKRSKLSRKNTVLLHPDLEELLSEHFAWHQEYDPANPYFFPGERNKPIYESTLNHILRRTCERLKLPLFTPHGGRAYFATKLRSDKLGEAEIASRIGDKTVSLIQTTYGGDPFDLAKPLSFRPETGLPVWKRWRELCGAARKTGNVEAKI